MQRASRPVGLTILAVFEILFGIVGLISSLALIGLSALFATLPRIGGLLGSIGLIIGGIALFFSLIWLATGVGFLHGRGWAWTLGMIFSVLSLLGAVGALAIGLITGGIGGSIFWGLMLYYLTRNHVKSFFGKGMLPMTMSYSGPPAFRAPVTNIPSYGGPPASLETPTSVQTLPTSALQMGNGSKNPATSSSMAGSRGLVSCPYCGSRLTIGSPKCMTCGATI